AFGGDDVYIALNLDGTVVDACKALARAFPRLKCEGAAGHLVDADEDMHMRGRAAHVPKAQLGIQVDIVVPGQPVDGVQLAIWQSHHFRKARIRTLNLIDHPLRTHHWNTIGTYHFDR